MGRPCNPCGWPLGPMTGRICGLGTGEMPSADRRGSDATGMSSGIGWFGIDGFVAAGAAGAAGADAGADVDAVAADVAPLAFDA